ncbi:hypothetical protein HPP92_026254 [Vanilla planifolia]|uniref:RRM domain-containing protein n=1 Tax=Vanilla planifolia TaxID=51239 RepID=A0A835U6I8_VANPL|nr:hypothetical protein HPP92_026254 [Vanilla planifolia]
MDAAPSSYYHQPPPPSHHSYYHHPSPVQYPPLPQVYSHSTQPPPLPLGSHYGVPPPLSRHDELRTLFIAGLPDDCKSREIYNLFRDFPGYESSHLRSSTESSHPYAFAVFADQHSAVSAMHALNGMVFDLENDSTLYIELAKSNSKFAKRSKTGFGSRMYMPGRGNSAYSTNGYPSTQSHASYDYAAAHDVEPKKSTSSSNYVPQDNPPCPTLFVANLARTCSEQELAQLFSKYPGFLKLKMQNKSGVPVAFVDFQDTVCSTEALNRLQGTTMHASAGDTLRLEYAKARMGLRKRDSYY